MRMRWTRLHRLVSIPVPVCMFIDTSWYQPIFVGSLWDNYNRVVSYNRHKMYNYIITIQWPVMTDTDHKLHHKFPLTVKKVRTLEGLNTCDVVLPVNTTVENRFNQSIIECMPVCTWIWLNTQESIVKGTDSLLLFTVQS